MNPKRFVVSLVLLLAGVAPLQAQTRISPEKEKSIRQLLDVMGTTKLTQQMTTQMMAMLKQSQPGVPEELWSRFEKKLDAREVIDLVIPVYDKHFSKEDIDGLTAFYESPLGQKVVRTLPQVSQESMEIGQAWGRRKAEEVLQELQQERSKPSQKGAPPARP